MELAYSTTENASPMNVLEKLIDTMKQIVLFMAQGIDENGL